MVTTLDIISLVLIVVVVLLVIGIVAAAVGISNRFFSL